MPHPVPRSKGAHTRHRKLQSQLQMPDFKITIKIVTLEPPHESLGCTRVVLSASILDTYRKLYDVLRVMPNPPEADDAQPE